MTAKNFQKLANFRICSHAILFRRQKALTKRENWIGLIGETVTKLRFQMKLNRFLTDFYKHPTIAISGQFWYLKDNFRI